MVFLPTRHVIDVSSPSEIVIDQFGDEHQKLGEFAPLKVIGWAITMVDESEGDSILRTVTQLDVYSPTKIDAGARVRTPDGVVWEVRGESEDYNHGPFWSPDAFVTHCRKVDG